ncbi:hypothetical protein MP638_004642 [Amoeboaphelidium occidentale]|nr:hypothetical protein MP638_004642 [Amoeboaphelidium occidentale]
MFGGNQNNSSGFSLGGTNNTQKPGVNKPVSGFNFGAAGTTQAPSFSFGNAPTAGATQQAQASSSSTGFSFGASTAAPSTQTGNATQGPSSTGLSFGSAAKPAQPSGANSFSFGGTTATPSFGGVPAAKDATAKSTEGFSIGGAPAAGAATSSAPSFSFGAATAAATPAKPTDTKPSTGGFSFGASGATTVVPSTPAPSTGFSFQTPAQSSNVVSQSPLTLSALKTPATTGTTGLGLAKTEKPPETPSFKIPTVPPSKDTTAATTTVADTTKTAAPTSSFSFGAKPGDSSKDSTAKPNEKHAVPSTEILSNLKGKTLGDILNDWQTELHDSVALFHRKAAEVAEADMKVLENADKIYKLATEAKKMSSVQENMSSTLDYIESQQAHLDKELDVFEDKLRAALSQNDSRIKLAIPGGVSAQEEREKTYQLAESLVREVETLQQDVDDLVKQANSIWNPSKDGKESSIELINKVLNEQFNSLRWVDQTLDQLKQRYNEVKEFDKVMESDMQNASNRLRKL